MEFIKQIIREELEKVLTALDETDFYAASNIKSVIDNSNPKQNIIYDYEKGRIFAEDNLAVDIVYLDRYRLSDYLPKSQEDEMWTFEFDTVAGTILIVDVRRIIIQGKNFWTLSFGQLYKGESMPTLIGEIKNIEGYDKFVQTVNSRISSKIDPSRY